MTTTTVTKADHDRFHHPGCRCQHRKHVREAAQIILAVTEPNQPAMLHGTRGSVPVMPHGVLVHPEHRPL